MDKANTYTWTLIPGPQTGEQLSFYARSFLTTFRDRFDDKYCFEVRERAFSSIFPCCRHILLRLIPVAQYQAQLVQQVNKHHHIIFTGRLALIQHSQARRYLEMMKYRTQTYENSDMDLKLIVELINSKSVS